MSSCQIAYKSKVFCRIDACHSPARCWNLTTVLLNLCLVHWSTLDGVHGGWGQQAHFRSLKANLFIKIEPASEGCFNLEQQTISKAPPMPWNDSRRAELPQSPMVDCRNIEAFGREEVYEQGYTKPNSSSKEWHNYAELMAISTHIWNVASIFVDHFFLNSLLPLWSKTQRHDSLSMYPLINQWVKATS